MTLEHEDIVNEKVDLLNDIIDSLETMIANVRYNNKDLNPFAEGRAVGLESAKDLLESERGELVG